MARGSYYRTSVQTSWAWIRWDLPARMLPLAVAPFLFIWVSQTPLSALGIPGAHVGRDLLLALPLGLLGFAIASGYGEYLSRHAGRWFVPDGPDLALQSGYYIILNAPIEEWFFRGFLQGSIIRWWHAPALGYVVATLIFGAYHFLGRWGWRPVLGATVAGFGLGLLYLWQPAPASLLLPTLVHAAITCGFLSVGPFLVFEWRRARGTIKLQADAKAVS